MKPIEYKFLQYPRGANKGGVLDVEICPTISCSSWENNCFLIEIMKTDTTLCLNSKVDGKQPSLQDRIYDVEGCSTAITTSFLPSIAEPKVINPLKGQSDNGWHFEQQVYDAEGIARAVKAGEGSGNIPKVIVYDDYNQNIPKNQSVIGTITTNIGSSTPRNGIKLIEVFEPISVAMRGRNPNNPSERGKSNGNYKQRLEMNESGVANTITSVQKDSMVAEPRVEQVGNIYPDTDTFKNRTMGRVYSNEGLSPTINCCGGGDREPKVVENRYRIRKLTPRECFRLMGVDDADIDKIQASGISNSQQYKCAGNSIVVDVLYHIFRKRFCETENEDSQLSLF